MQAQALAYSLDGGLTWTKYAGNPVLDIGSTNFRDPQGVLVRAEQELADGRCVSDQHKVSFYTSTNLKNWTHRERLRAGRRGRRGVGDPDIVPLHVDGDHKRLKWVLVVGINPGGYASGSG